MLLHAIAFSAQLALAPISLEGQAVELADVIFVANRTSPQVTLIDSRSEEVLGRIELSIVPTQIIALNQRRKLVAINSDESALGFADLYGVLPPREVYLGFRPDYLQTSPDGDLAAVSGSAAGVVALFEVGGPRERQRFENLQTPGYMIFDKDGRRLFVSHRDSDAVSVIDLDAGGIAKRIDLGEGAAGAGGIAHLTRTPGGELGFALHRDRGLMSIINLETTERVATVALPGPAARAFPTADSQYVLVPNAADESVSMISTWTLKESARFSAASGMTGINTAVVETVALVLSEAERKAVLLDLRDERRLGEFALPARPETGVTAASGLKVFVALGDSDRVGVIDVVEGRLTKTIAGVGREPWAVFSAGGLSYCH